MKILMFSTHSMKYIWYSPQKSKYPLYIHIRVVEISEFKLDLSELLKQLYIFKYFSVIIYFLNIKRDRYKSMKRVNVYRMDLLQFNSFMPNGTSVSSIGCTFH